MEGLSNILKGQENKYDEWKDTPAGIVSRFKKEFETIIFAYTAEGKQLFIMCNTLIIRNEIIQWFLNNTNYIVDSVIYPDFHNTNIILQKTE